MVSTKQLSDQNLGDQRKKQPVRVVISCESRERLLEETDRIKALLPGASVKQPAERSGKYYKAYVVEK